MQFSFRVQTASRRAPRASSFSNRRRLRLNSDAKSLFGLLGMCTVKCILFSVAGWNSSKDARCHLTERLMASPQ